MQSTPPKPNQTTQQSQARMLMALLNVMDGLNNQLRTESSHAKRELLLKHLMASVERITPLINVLTLVAQPNGLSMEAAHQKHAALILSCESLGAILQTLFKHGIPLQADTTVDSSHYWEHAMTIVTLLQVASKPLEDILAMQVTLFIQALFRQCEDFSPDARITALRPHFIVLRNLLRSAFLNTKRWQHVIELNQLSYQLSNAAGYPLTAARDLHPMEISALKKPSIVFYEISRVIDSTFYMELKHDHYPLMLQGLIWLFYSGLHLEAKQLHLTLHQLLDQLHQNFITQTANASEFTPPAEHVESILTLRGLLEDDWLDTSDIFSSLARVLYLYETVAEHLASTCNAYARNAVIDAYLFLSDELPERLDMALQSISSDINFYMNDFKRRTQLDEIATKQFFEYSLRYSDIFRNLVASTPALPGSERQALDVTIEMAHTYWLHLQFDKAEQLYANTKLSPLSEITRACIALTQAQQAAVFLERFQRLHLANNTTEQTLFLLALHAQNTSLLGHFDHAISYLLQATSLYASLNLAQHTLGEEQSRQLEQLPEELRKVLTTLDAFSNHFADPLPEWIIADASTLPRLQCTLSKLKPLQQLIRPTPANTPVADATPVPTPKKKKKRAKKTKAVEHSPEVTLADAAPMPQADPTPLYLAESPPVPELVEEIVETPRVPTPSSLPTTEVTPESPIPSSDDEIETLPPITPPSTTIDRRRYLPGSGYRLSRDECFAILADAAREQPLTAVLSYSFQCQLTAIATYVNDAVRRHVAPDYALCAQLRLVLTMPRRSAWLLSKLALTPPHCPDHTALTHDARLLFPQLWIAALGMRTLQPMHAYTLERSALDYLQPNHPNNPPAPLGDAFGLLLFGLQCLLFTRYQAQLQQAQRLLDDAEQLFSSTGNHHFWAQTAAVLQTVSRERCAFTA